MNHSVLWDVAIALGAILCALLQLASLRIGEQQAVPLLLRAGRAAMVAGWSVAAVQMSYLLAMTGDIPLATSMLLWIGLLELGTVFGTVHWIMHPGVDR